MCLLPPRVLAALAALFLAGLTAGCGLSDQNRPFVVSTWPTTWETTDGPLPFIRVTYNEPVTVLNPNDVLVTVNGGFIAVTVLQHPDEANNIYVFPVARTAFPENAEMSITVIQGLAINQDRHYASGKYITGFNTGREPPLPVAGLATVSLLRTTTGLAVQTVPTPAARRPVGVLATTVDGVRRIWVQLEDGGGTGEALAYFEPGDGVMTPIALTTSGGDLLATSSTISVDPLGGAVYVAYRDDASGRVRVYSIDTVTATETAVLELESVPADAATMPTGLGIGEQRIPPQLVVSAADGATGMLAALDPRTFVEIDHDALTAGVQGIPLPAGGGPTTVANNISVVADPGNTDAAIAQGNGPAATSVGTVVGSTAALVRAPDGAIVLHALTGFAGLDALQRRARSDGFTSTTAVAVSDDIGGIAQGATDVYGISFLAVGDRMLVFLATASGPMMTTWAYDNGGNFAQLDLDLGTPGIQGVPIAVVPLVVGANYGSFPPAP
ncbi:MAG: hypothetical protein O2894_00595 [Planctomycetota bacterium]|nr:hypothetical protein [Planctomycetota bacterium]